MSAKIIAQSADIECKGGAENFPCGAEFSPDGLCLLSSTCADSKLHLYNTVTSSKDDGGATEWKAALSVNGGNAVRSFDWYPFMKSSDPSTCCFLAAARNQPVQLFDAYTGAVRACYRPINALDELESATVAQFHPNGQKIAAAGFRTDRTIHIFETAIPGRDSTILRLGKTRRSTDGQKGLVSSIDYSKDGRLLAVGTYAPGSIYVYDERSGERPTGTILNGLCVVGHGRSHSRKKRRFGTIDDDGDEWLSSAKIKWYQSRAQGGVTQLKFAPDQEYILYSASRRSGAVLSWDLRMLSGDPDYQSRPVCGFASFATENDTNQRLQFDISSDGQTVYVGGRDKCLRMYNIASGDLDGTIEDGIDDAVNGVSCSSQVNGKAFLALAIGSRQFPSEDDLDQDCVACSTHTAGSLRLYSI
jgi:hypothetical protein